MQGRDEKASVSGISTCVKTAAAPLLFIPSPRGGGGGEGGSGLGNRLPPASSVSAPLLVVDSTLKIVNNSILPPIPNISKVWIIPNISKVWLILLARGPLGTVDVGHSWHTIRYHIGEI